jgi:cell cycle checkpoint protein
MESRLKQRVGHAFVDKNLFTSYTLSPPKRAGQDVVDLSTGASAGDSDDLEDQDHTVSFAISLAALLECLQIFGADTYREKWQNNSGGSNFAGGTNAAMSRSGPGTVFDQQVLRIGGTCCISYHARGYPLYLM